MTSFIYLLIGLGVGYYLGRQTRGKAAGYDVMKDPEKWAKIRELLRTKDEISNDDIQVALGVSDATATRYLEMLEKTGDIVQVGDTGRGVVYKKNN